MDLPAESIIRLTAFGGVLPGIGFWELRAPRRRLSLSRWQRWPHNLGILLIDTALVRLLLPTAAVGVALAAADRGWGLLNILAVPDWAAIVISVIALDLAIYGQHVAFHAIQPLWRLHRMHHADLDFDAITGVRFHPVEILLSLLIKLAVVALIGAAAVGVLIFEVLLNATSVFNHGNVRIPAWLERRLRWFVVTPEMHRVHHSIRRAETDSNFGFNLPWWDRLFRTYRAEPVDGHQTMTIGIPQFRDPRELRLDQLLLQPFRG